MHARQSKTNKQKSNPRNVKMLFGRKSCTRTTKLFRGRWHRILLAILLLIVLWTHC